MLVILILKSKNESEIGTTEVLQLEVHIDGKRIIVALKTFDPY